MQVADAFGIGSGIIYSCGAHEEGDQPSITRVEVKVGLLWNIEIGLLHNQWHTQHSLVEIDSRLTVGTNECDMVDTVSLDFTHGCMSALDIPKSRRTGAVSDRLPWALHSAPPPDRHDSRSDPAQRQS